MENTIQQILKRFCIPVHFKKWMTMSFILSFVLSGDLWSAESLWETKFFDKDDGMSHNMVFCIFQDTKGFVWLGTKDGLNRFDGQQFKVWRQEDGLKGKVVYDIAEDSSHRLWLATDEGICRFNPKDNTFFVPVSYDVFRPGKVALPCKINNKAQKLMVDARDRLWVFAGKRAFVFENELLSDVTVPLMQALGFMPTLMTADDKGNICFAYSREGYNIVWYNPEGNSVITTISQPYTVTALQAAPHGKLLVGTRHNGIIVYDSTGCITRGPQYDVQNIDICTSTVYDIAFSSSDSTTYAVASESGLSLSQNDTLTFIPKVNVSTSQVLDTSWKVIIDNDGGLWSVDYYGGISYRTLKHVETSHSVSVSAISPLENDFSERDSFSEQKAIGSEDVEMSHHSVFTEKIRPVVFVGLYTKGKEIAAGLPYAETVYLAHSQAAVTIMVSVLNYAHPWGNRMVYRFDGSNEWKEVDANGCFSCNLRKKKNTVYVCQIPSSDFLLDEIRTDDCARLAIILEPSPWRTPVANMVYALCLIGIVSLFFFPRRLNVVFASRRKEAERLLVEQESQTAKDANLSKLSKADELFLQAISDYFGEHLEQCKIDYDNMAFTLNMSRSTLYRRVKAVTGVTPNEYCRMFRLNKAAEHLKEGNYLVKEVCRNVGFSSESYFAKMFKKQFGVLPNDYVERTK